MDPESGVSKVPSMLSKVDFPAPLGPMMVIKSPESKDKETSEKTESVFSPFLKDLDKFFASKIIFLNRPLLRVK